jgi:hypothetical protein
MREMKEVPIVAMGWYYEGDAVRKGKQDGKTRLYSPAFRAVRLVSLRLVVDRRARLGADDLQEHGAVRSGVNLSSMS